MARELLFLGTGPTGGIQKRGKSGRLESSVLIKTDRGRILIDVSRHFKKQNKQIKRLDAIMITHAHRDAVGGLAQLHRWMKSKRRNSDKIPLYALEKTIKKIGKQFKRTDYLNFTAINPFLSFKLFDITVLPFSVKHSIQKGFPTVGYKLNFPDKFSLIYAPDVGGWDKKTEKILKSPDLLIIDGAMWGKKMIAHLDIKEVLPRICSWPVKKIIFTQIGKTAPPYDIMNREIKKLCPRALPAHDGLVINI